MPGNFKKDDLRVIKTYKVILAALYKLLKHRNFRYLTVNDLCEEAQISRATFYAHFKDKYDLLKYWLTYLKSEIIGKDNTYIEEEINHFINNNTKLITNLLEDSNSETIELLQDFMISILEVNMQKDSNGKINPKYVVLTNFCVGGMVNYFSWMIKNKFPLDLYVTNSYLYDIINYLLKWETKQD